MLKIKQQTVDLLLLIFTIIVGIISYILNLGWIRVILFIPFFAYNIIVLITGIIYVVMNHNSGKIKQNSIFYLGLLTYIIFNIFFCDGGIIGPPYYFFGLVEIYGNASLFNNISMVSFIISLICIILNITVVVIKN